MRALFFDHKLHLEHNYELIKPEGEVLIKILMAGICNTDLEIAKGYMGFNGIIGHEFVGIVEEAENKELIGKRVCGEINAACLECEFCHKNLKTHCPNRTVLGILARNGSFCDYTTLPEENLHIIPDSISDEEACFVEPLAAAYEILEQIKISPEDQVVILGDGKLGLLIAMLLASIKKEEPNFGSWEISDTMFSSDNMLSSAGINQNVIAVGKHIDKLNILQNAGIKTMDLEKASQLKADVVIDATGKAEGLEMAINIIKPRGKIILKTTIAKDYEINLAPIVINEISLIGSRCGPFKPAIEALSNKQIDVNPLISKVYSFDDAEEAFKYAKTSGVMKVLLKM